MGPADISDMSSTSSNQTLNLPKLRSDSSNWSTYQEQLLNYVTSKLLKKHLLGTARKPVVLTEWNGSHYKPQSLAPLTDEELEKHEEEEETYEQKQAAVREVIYRTIDKSTFLQVKNESTAADVWKKVISIHGDKGSLYEMNLLTQLQTLRLTENGDMREHLTKMSEIKERLAEMNCPVTDELFVSYIRTSLSLVPNYQTLLTTLNATAHESGRKLTSSNLIWHLTEEANSLTLEDSINKSNAAMMAASSTTSSKGKGAKGKGKSKGKLKVHCSNPNCDKDSHTFDQCFAKGGGKEKEAPEWFKKLAARKVASASAHVADNGNDDDENYVMLTYSLPDDPTALIVTSDFKAEAHAISGEHGIILDSGASHHFSPDCSKLMNYREISPEPIRD